MLCSTDSAINPKQGRHGVIVIVNRNRSITIDYSFLSNRNRNRLN